MKTYSIIVLLILVTSSVQAFEYQEQTPQRLFAPKKKIYPFLDQLEASLYPQQNFKRDNPSQRLERIEIAVFGSKQSGSISTRLNNLQSELNNWQIGNMKVVKTQEPKAERLKPNAYIAPAHSALSVQHPASKDYDYMNYRLATPLVQNIGRRAIDAIFK